MIEETGFSISSEMDDWDEENRFLETTREAECQIARQQSIGLSFLILALVVTIMHHISEEG